MGADLNAHDAEGNTLLHKVGEAKLYEDEAVNLDAQRRIIETLIHAGANVNARAKWEKTPLHVCSNSDNAAEIAKILLANGADVNAKDDDGATLLFGTLPNQRIIEFLIRI